MYQDLKKKFWWTRIKREIAKYVFKCDTCSQGRSFETRQKPTTLKHSRVEMGKHLYELHCGLASHLTWV
jgi:hypothetical protein